MSGPAYDRDAVQQQIDAHNRRPRGGRIGKREARLIHALLKGHTNEGEKAWPTI